MASVDPSPALTAIAVTGERFCDFRPYVAAIADDGVVAFQAALTGGGTGVFTGDGDRLATVLECPAGAIERVRSHPDRNLAGDVCFYADLAGGEGAVVRVRGGRPELLARTGEGFAEIGPLGPTMNEQGTVAFRAAAGDGAPGVFTSDGAVTSTIAGAGDALRAFEGLPVVNREAAVAVRADTGDGRQRIWVHDGRTCSPWSRPGIGSASSVGFRRSTMPVGSGSAPPGPGAGRASTSLRVAPSRRASRTIRAS